MLTKFPYCEAAGLFYTRNGEIYFNEAKFFSSLDYNTFLVYELSSSYPKVKVEEVEQFLEARN